MDAAAALLRKYRAAPKLQQDISKALEVGVRRIFKAHRLPLPAVLCALQCCRPLLVGKFAFGRQSRRSQMAFGLKAWIAAAHRSWQEMAADTRKYIT